MSNYPHQRRPSHSQHSQAAACVLALADSCHGLLVFILEVEGSSSSEYSGPRISILPWKISQDPLLSI